MRFFAAQVAVLRHRHTAPPAPPRRRTGNRHCPRPSIAGRNARMSRYARLVGFLRLREGREVHRASRSIQSPAENSSGVMRAPKAAPTPCAPSSWARRTRTCRAPCASRTCAGPGQPTATSRPYLRWTAELDAIGRKSFCLASNGRSTRRLGREERNTSIREPSPPREPHGSRSAPADATAGRPYRLSPQRTLLTIFTVTAIFSE